MSESERVAKKDSLRAVSVRFSSDSLRDLGSKAQIVERVDSAKKHSMWDISFL